MRAAPQIAPFLQNLVIFACPMDALEAQQIFQALEQSQTLNHVMFYLREDHGDGVVAAFSRFIRNSQHSRASHCIISILAILTRVGLV